MALGSMAAWRFWVDRGGTFTDLIGCDPTGTLHIRKVLSEGGERDPAVQAMRELLGVPTGEPIGPAQIESVRLGTTVATNALLERRDAPLVLLTNSGLADLLLIGDQHRADLFAFVQSEVPFLASEVVEVPGRLDADGAELELSMTDQPGSSGSAASSSDVVSLGAPIWHGVHD